MTETLWFTRKPGDSVSVGSDENEDGVTLLTYSNDLPDWVKTPQEIGGQRLQVLRGFTSQCPLCQTKNIVRHIECSDDFFVAECSTHGFSWYKKERRVPAESERNPKEDKMTEPKYVAEQVLLALEAIPPDDRIGFLFGMMIGMLQTQGFTDEEIYVEVKHGLDTAFKKN